MKNFFFIFFILSSSINAFSQTINFKDVSNNNLKNIKSLMVNCNEVDFKSFVKEIDKFNALETISIENYQESYFPETLKQLSISSFKLKSSPDVDLKALFELIAQIPTLKELRLENNDIEQLPSSSSFLKNLTSLSITSNQNLEVNSIVATLSNAQNLKVLDLSNNAIENISSLWAVRHIDSLKIEDNLIDDFAFLNSLKDGKLKYISIDEQDTDVSNKIQQMLPDIVLYQKPSEILPVSYYQDTDIRSSNITFERHYGEISVGGVKFKALSNAYYHYHKIFNNRRFIYDFDTLMFNQRYLDTNYAITWKRQENVTYDVVGLKKQFCFWSKEVKFKIDPKHSNYFYKTFPELRAYHNITWVYKGNLTKREFKRKYIKGKGWLDIRIYYHEEAKDFTIQLKSKSGFEDINSYPLAYRKRKVLPLEMAQKQYLKTYIKYSKVLDTRKKRFHTELIRNKKKYERTRNKSINKTWKSFQKIYMSEAERQMSREDWLLYYDEVIKSEIRALSSAATSVDLLARSLDLEKYRESNIEDLTNKNAQLSDVTFTNHNKETLPAKQFLIIDLQDRSYNKYRADLGISLQSVFLTQGNTCIVVELRNGDMGYIRAEALNLIEPNKDGAYYIPLDIIEKELSTIGQMYKTLKL